MPIYYTTTGHGERMALAGLWLDLRCLVLAGLDLRRAYVAGANFYGANLDGAKLCGVTLDGANFDIKPSCKDYPKGGSYV